MTESVPMSQRFRGFLPVVVDIETGGLDPSKNPVLELAAITIETTETGFIPSETKYYHVKEFDGSTIDHKSLEINKIIPDHPFRFAKAELEVLTDLNSYLKKKMKEHKCKRCVLVGHNAWFDLAFLNAMVERNKFNANVFHKFTSIDTATIGALLYKHTVLSQLMKLSGIPFESNEQHSALYDATKTAEFFCASLNKVKDIIV